MRDPNRIYKYMAALTKYWAENPDLRFGQMVQNLCDLYERKNPSKDSFYAEDAEFFEETGLFKEN